MSELARVGQPWLAPFLAVTETLTFRTQRGRQILDITPAVASCLPRAGLWTGFANVQVLHTTLGLLINENERLLFQDLQRTLARLAPQQDTYRHDDLGRRFPPPPPDERRNGHAHCRAMVLRATETVNVEGGALILGRWQRILLVELDGPQTRSISVALLGAGRPE
jgi:secondary thiamine-phosphate synthase enzyme